MRWLIILLLVFSACNDKDKAEKPALKFNKTQWNTKNSEGKNYLYRAQMITSVLNDYTWAGLTKDSVARMLGEPDGVEENIFLLYHYEQKYLGSFILSTQSLVVQIDSNNNVVLARTN